MTETTKVNKLTGHNVSALRDLLGDRVTVTNTTATFPGTPEQALELVAEAKTLAAKQHGQKGHPFQSLHAVERKLIQIRDDSNWTPTN